MKNHLRSVFSGSIGDLIEWYDLYAYSVLFVSWFYHDTEGHKDYEESHRGIITHFSVALYFFSAALCVFMALCG